jgi:putative FmdB family regulatory protein
LSKRTHARNDYWAKEFFASSLLDLRHTVWKTVVPAYEYRCTCGDTMTVIRSITAEENKPICAKCAKEMTRTYESPPIQFKGGGWAGKD